MRFVTFSDSGVIKAIYSHEDQIKENVNFIVAEFDVDGDFYYVNENQELAPRLDYDLTNIPAPSIIRIEGTEYEVTETPQIEFDYPGEYNIEVVPEDPKYMYKEFTHVVDA